MSIPAAVTAEPTPTASVEPAPNADRVLALIRARFGSHRPPPPFETYTLTRRQDTPDGQPDGQGSYVVHVWVRNADGAALTRTLAGNGTSGPLTFDRPAFNEPRDPGPPTADLFGAANGPSEYRVDSMETLGNVVHLRIVPMRDPERNRLREIFADKQTYELRKLIAADKLFIGGGTVYPVTFTITVGTVDGHPVVTYIQGLVGGNYNDSGKEVNYTFTAITFPHALPDWYFEPRTYGQHGGDAPV